MKSLSMARAVFVCVGFLAALGCGGVNGRSIGIGGVTAGDSNAPLGSPLGGLRRSLLQLRNAAAGANNCENRGATNCLLESGKNLVKATGVIKPVGNPFMSLSCEGFCDNQNVCLEKGDTCKDPTDTLVQYFGENVGCQDMSAAECMVATGNVPQMCLGWCNFGKPGIFGFSSGACLPLNSTWCDSALGYSLTTNMDELQCASRLDCFDCLLGNKNADATRSCGWCPADSSCVDLTAAEVCATAADTPYSDNDLNCPLQDQPITTRAPVNNSTTESTSGLASDTVNSSVANAGNAGNGSKPASNVGATTVSSPFGNVAMLALTGAVTVAFGGAGNFGEKSD